MCGWQLNCKIKFAYVNARMFCPDRRLMEIALGAASQEPWQNLIISACTLIQSVFHKSMPNCILPDMSILTLIGLWQFNRRWSHPRFNAETCFALFDLR